MQRFTTHGARFAGGGAALGCALVIGLASGCAASSAAGDTLGTPVAVTPTAAEPSTSVQPATPVVTSDQALAIALADAGLTVDQVTGVKVTLDTEDGTPVWDVEFYDDGRKHELEIRAADGAVVDRDGRRPGAPATTAPTSMAVMSVDQAKQVVLMRVPNATSVRITLDHDGGRVVYEGEVIVSGQKLEFEIDAVTGEWLEWDADDHDD